MPLNILIAFFLCLNIFEISSSSRGSQSQTRIHNTSYEPQVPSRQLEGSEALWTRIHSTIEFNYNAKLHPFCYRWVYLFIYFLIKLVIEAVLCAELN